MKENLMQSDAKMMSIKLHTECQERTAQYYIFIYKTERSLRLVYVILNKESYLSGISQ